MAAIAICLTNGVHAIPSTTISTPTSNPTYETALTTATLSGAASTNTGSIASMSWDNLNTGDAGIIQVTSASSISWTSPAISLKPGKNEIAITAIDSQGYSGTDKITITRQTSGPSISNIRVQSSSVRVHEKYEISFDLSTSADNYFFQYDPSPPAGITPGIGVSAKAIITTPSGKTENQPAFYYTATVQDGSSTNPHFSQEANSYWKIRYSPRETGTYQVSIFVQDKTGTATASIGTFTATSPVKKGFIGVSEADTRYFEFSNGDIYWPIGPAWGNNYAQYKDTGQNLERPWMGGSGAYSTNWARWMSSAEELGNEGFAAKLDYQEHYPGHELSYILNYPDATRYWLSNWMDDGFGARIEPNTQYQIKLRLKTAGISGPRIAGQPYGLALKNHGWVGFNDNIDTLLRSSSSWVGMITRTRDWHTIVQRFTTGSSVNNDFSIYLENVNSGSAYIDELSIREVLPDGSLGGELIRQPKADLHNYVEQRPAAFFDWQQSQGEANGVFYKYVVHDKNDWIQNHLTTSGQFAETGDGYYQSENTKARWLLRQWYTYIIARWGYSTQVHSWELNNEGPPDEDPPGSGSAPHWRTAQAFAKFMHDNNPHPQMATTSFWCCWRPEFWGNEASFPDIDYADIHEYTRNDAIGYDMAEWTNTWSLDTYSDRIGKPIMRGETGISDENWQPNSYLQNSNPGIWYHNLLWAGLNPGGMSEPNYWYSEHFSAINRMQVSKPFYDYVKNLDLNKGGYADATATSTNNNLRIYGQKNLANDKAHLWIQNKDHTWRNVMGVANPISIRPQTGSITIRMNPARTYNAVWYNTYTGATIRTDTISSNSQGDLALQITSLTDDVAVTISGPGGQQPSPPTVALTSPANGAAYAAPATVTISATANDLDGTISRVEFYQGTNMLYSDNTQPYSYTWTSVPEGTYSITARAIDSSSQTAVSSEADIIVSRTNISRNPGDINQDSAVNILDLQIVLNDFGKNNGYNPAADLAQPFGMINLYDIMVVVKNWGSETENQLPSVVLTSPANGATISGVIQVRATATDSSGIAGVQFMIDGSNMGAEDTNAPYTLSWNTSTISNGIHTLSARARDNEGSTNTSTISVNVNNIVQPVDTTPPDRSNGQPTGNLPAGTATITLSLTTNEAATCKYSTQANTAYSGMTGTFTTTGGTTHTRSISGLTNGQAYRYYTKCIDAAENPNAEDYIVSFSISSITPLHTGEWTQFGHDAQRTSYTAETVETPWKYKWQWNGAGPDGKTQAGHISVPDLVQPITGGSRVYIMAGNAVYALNAETGVVLWSRTGLGTLSSTAAYKDESIYVASGNGNLYKLNAADGSIISTFTASSPLNLAPLIAGNNVYVVAGNGMLYAVNANTMAQVWSYAGGSPGETPASYSPSRNSIIYLTQDLYVHSVNADSGLRNWRVKPTIRTYTLANPESDLTEAREGWPVIAEQHGIVFVRYRLEWQTLWNGPDVQGTYPTTNNAIRNFLTSNPDEQALFALDIDDGSTAFIPAVGNGGAGDGGYLPMGPQPVIRTINNQEVAYMLFRSRLVCAAESWCDSREDTTMGEMTLDSSTVPGYTAGDMRFVAWRNLQNPSQYYHDMQTDEMMYITGSGSTLFHNHWLASEAYKITDRGNNYGNTYINAIRTTHAPNIIWRQVYCPPSGTNCNPQIFPGGSGTSWGPSNCPYDADTRHCNAGLYPYGDQRPYPPGFYEYHNDHNSGSTPFAIVSNGLVLVKTIDGGLIALDNGDQLTGITGNAIRNIMPITAKSSYLQEVLPAAKTSLPPRIPYTFAEHYIDQQVTVYGKIESAVNRLPKAIYLGFEDPHDGYLLIRIFAKDLDKFSYNPLDLIGRIVEVTGKVTLYWPDGKDPEIIVTDPSKIKLIR